MAAAVAVTVVVAGPGVVATLDRGDTSTTIAPAVDPPTPTPTYPGPPLATDDTVSLDDFEGSGMLAELRADGKLRLKRGVVVVRWVDNPLGRTAPDSSMGLVLYHWGETSWQLLDNDDQGDTRDAWLAQQVELAQQPETTPKDSALGDDPGSPLIDLRADGTLDLAPGVEVLKRIENPAGQPLSNRSVAVAFTYEGRERWAVLQVLVDDEGNITGAGASTTYANRADQLDSLAAYAEANDSKVYHP